MSACAVPWCTAVTTGAYCPIHAKRPPERHETREDWEKRLRAEDRAAKRARERAESDAIAAANKAHA